MTCTLHVTWDEGLTGYDFGPQYPMAPLRLKLTIELAQALGLFHTDGVTMGAPPMATHAELELVHDPLYIAMVKMTGSPARQGQGVAARALLMYGLGTEDDPVFTRMHEASALVAGSTLAAAQAVWTSAAQHGPSIAGGLHHAMAASASGFCVYNDPAVAIAWLLSQGAERIAYVDVDAHHGDGVQAARKPSRLPTPPPRRRPTPGRRSAGSLRRWATLAWPCSALRTRPSRCRPGLARWTSCWPPAPCRRHRARRT
jgi:acetoin utilization protein AcuC